MKVNEIDPLLDEIQKCTLCREHLPLGPNPLVNFSPHSKILITGQAPGVKAHNSSTPWNDASGDRLCEWLGISRQQLYDEDLFALVPMGFCYPGKEATGDLGPRPECAQKWMGPVYTSLSNLKLHLLVGQYAMNYFLGDEMNGVTQAVRSWQKWFPQMMALPHPSPRNNIWLKKNAWFESELLPVLRKQVAQILKVGR